MRRVWVGVGANVGDPASNVREAIARLAATPAFTAGRVSGLYETAPWGRPDQPWFVNAVVELATDAPPAVVLDRLFAIENEMGRVRRERWGPRTIDLDYLLDDSETSATDVLTLPHPEVENRAFVLVPLLDLQPDLRLPSGERARDRADALVVEQPLRRLEAVPTIAPWP